MPAPALPTRTPGSEAVPWHGGACAPVRVGGDGCRACADACVEGSHGCFQAAGVAASSPH